MKLAFCGLGIMGEAMVQRLLQGGHAVRVWNRTRSKADRVVAQGAQWCDTPAEAAQGVAGVLMCLLDAATVTQVVFGPEGVAQCRDLPWLVDHSSIAPGPTRALGQRLSEVCGAAWLDAPVSGGVAGVREGRLTVMVGGDTDALAQAEPAMRAYAAQITHLGAAGAGQAAKLCNQIIVSTTVAAIAEALVFAERNGIDAARLPQALAGGWADSKPLQVFVPRMLQTQPESIGALSTMLKDVDTALSVAREADAPLPVTACVQQLLRTASATGLGQAELSALIGLFDVQRRDAFLRQVSATTSS
jgi:3-hydroxyisobutyrate dehydrogenase-like beta-hydroxyacid dehydrogenase